MDNEKMPKFFSQIFFFFKIFFAITKSFFWFCKLERFRLKRFLRFFFKKYFQLSHFGHLFCPFLKSEKKF